MNGTEFKSVNSEAAIQRFLADTHNLHDTCITSVDFRDSRLVLPDGQMDCNGNDAALIISLDSQFEGRRAQFQLMFAAVSRFAFDHDAAYDGLILSCAVALNEGGIRFACNECDTDARPLVIAKELKYRVMLCPDD
jgi:hypothetical protein